MTANMGNTDRAIRPGLGMAPMAAASESCVTGIDQSKASACALLAAGAMIATDFFRFRPIQMASEVKTCRN